MEAIDASSLGLLLISAIFFPPTADTNSILYLINPYNPIAALINTARDFLVGGQFLLFNASCIWIAVLFTLFIINMILMRVISPILIERLGN